jgi:hypothetical protein
MNDAPLLIEFIPRTRVYREPDAEPPKLPIVRNGPPGTFVLFATGRKVSLPTDQIVFADDSTGSARIGFGGMRFVGMEDGALIFHRARDLAPEETLSPERGRRMTLDPSMVAAISIGGRQLWPLG